MYQVPGIILLILLIVIQRIYPRYQVHGWYLVHKIDENKLLMMSYRYLSRLSSISICLMGAPPVVYQSQKQAVALDIINNRMFLTVSIMQYFYSSTRPAHLVSVRAEIPGTKDLCYHEIQKKSAFYLLLLHRLLLVDPSL